MFYSRVIFLYCIFHVWNYIFLCCIFPRLNFSRVGFFVLYFCAVFFCVWNFCAILPCFFFACGIFVLYFCVVLLCHIFVFYFCVIFCIFCCCIRSTSISATDSSTIFLEDFWSDSTEGSFYWSWETRTNSLTCALFVFIFQISECEQIELSDAFLADFAYFLVSINDTFILDF